MDLTQEEERVRRAEIALRSSRRGLKEKERSLTVGISGALGYMAVTSLLGLLAVGRLGLYNLEEWLIQVAFLCLYSLSASAMWRGHERNLWLVALPGGLTLAHMAYLGHWSPLPTVLVLAVPVGLYFLSRLRAKLASLPQENQSGAG